MHDEYVQYQSSSVFQGSSVFCGRSSVLSTLITLNTRVKCESTVMACITPAAVVPNLLPQLPVEGSLAQRS